MSPFRSHPLGRALAVATIALMTGMTGLASAEQAKPQNFLQTHPVEFPNGTLAYNGVTYSTEVGYRPLRLDIYRNPKTTAPAPVILFIHGGAWEGGNRQAQGKFADFPSVLADLAAKGYVVASAEHRLSGEAPFPAPYDDVQAAIRFLKDNATSYGINPEKFGIWGSSSGGQLAALAAVACNSNTLTRVRDKTPTTSTCVNTAAIWNGVFDFKAMEPAPTPAQNGHPRSRLLECNPGYCTNTVLETASPISYVDAHAPSFFLAHSRDDKVVPFAQSTEFEKKLKENGVAVSTYYVEGLQHGFVSDDPKVTKEAGEELLKRTVEYFDHTLK